MVKINLHNSTMEELYSVYLDIVKIHGEKAYNSNWLSGNGYSRIVNQIRKRNISWIDFRKKCGFKIINKFKRRNETLEELMDIYKSLIRKHGEKAYSSNWICKNGHQWLANQVRVKHKLTWNEFRKKSGIDKVLIRKIKPINELITEYLLILKKHGEIKYRSQLWMVKNGYRWITNHVRKNNISWIDFNRKTGIKVKPIRREYNIDELIESYKRAVKKHGENAYRSTWMSNNGYLWLYQRSRKLGFYWADFRKKCGFNKPLQRERLSIQELLEEFKSIESIHGEDDTRKVKWMMNNGYRWITEQVLNYDIKWNCFIQMSKKEIEMEFKW